MSQLQRVLFSLLFFFFFSNLATNCSGLAALSRLPGGEVTPEVELADGSRISGVSGENSWYWLGIPYGKADRWISPSPYGPVSSLSSLLVDQKLDSPNNVESTVDLPEIFNATSYGDACPQPLLPSLEWPQGQGISEDCLTINVWIPPALSRPSSSSSSSLLPVLVWIYGGGLTIGGSSQTPYDGSNLVHDDTVVVSFNYRVNAFGFLSLDEMTDSNQGRFGLADQELALKWVHDNIESFGGDPSRVTLFGQSAGGSSVSYLLLYSKLRQQRQQEGQDQRRQHEGNYPEPFIEDDKHGYNSNRDKNVAPSSSVASHNSSPNLYFHQAIIESGAPVLERFSNMSARAYSHILLEAINCSSSSSSITGARPERMKASNNATSFSPLACALNVPMDTIVKAAASMKVNHAIWDDKTYSFFDTLSQSTFAQVPIIFGNTLNETLAYAQATFQGKPIKPTDFRNALTTFAQATGYIGIDPQVLDLVATTFPCPPNTTDCTSHLGNIVSDITFNCPMNYIGDAYSKAGLPTWAYVFDHQPSWIGLTPASGVPHASEIKFVFGTYPSNNNTNISATSQEKALSSLIQQDWIDFVHEGVARWTPYSASSQSARWTYHTIDQDIPDYMFEWKADRCQQALPILQLIDSKI